MQYFYIIRITTHRFHSENEEGDIGIGYDMIIVKYLMVKIWLIENLRHNILEWNENNVPMKPKDCLTLVPGKLKLTKRVILKLLM